MLAGDLRARDEVVLRGGAVVHVNAVDVAPADEVVYNFNVAELETYAVGAAGVFVHNTNAGNPSQTVTTRVGELRTSIPAAQQGRITMAVAVVEDANGVRSVLVSTSELGGYLRPGVTLQPGETMVAGTGHAEANIISYAGANNLRVIDVGATRPVCALSGCDYSHGRQQLNYSEASGQLNKYSNLALS